MAWGIWNKIKKGFQKVVNKVKEVVPKVWNKVIKPAVNVAKDIILPRVPGKYADIGRKVVNGIDNATPYIDKIIN